MSCFCKEIIYMFLYRLFSTVDKITSFSKEIFSIYFEHNRNPIES